MHLPLSGGGEISSAQPLFSTSQSPEKSSPAYCYVPERPPNPRHLGSASLGQFGPIPIPLDGYPLGVSRRPAHGRSRALIQNGLPPRE
ncbi:hypothetical protein GL4_2664 [Methyloceanibacter caenitepidi]|uniref:Uncharacterized protein n=1 Tax=Methyloceanibacter caenitepidi TaxID=1384459 RepID=A0A0A8K569_9HYPH|nr:hypothetical protein GL4_2664 [Methyloceanibacter caenitepidi]